MFYVAYTKDGADPRTRPVTFAFNGGPGSATETLAMYIHKTTVDFLDIGYGSALAVLMFVVSAVITSGYLRHTRRDPGRH